MTTDAAEDVMCADRTDNGQGMIPALTFCALRKANDERHAYLAQKNSVARRETLVDWSNALAGEAGEVCNVTKKIQRYLDGYTHNKEAPDELKDQLMTEIGDVALYLDLLAQKAGFTLEECIRSAFNRKSDEWGLTFRV